MAMRMFKWQKLISFKFIYVLKEKIYLFFFILRLSLSLVGSVFGEWSNVNSSIYPNFIELTKPKWINGRGCHSVECWRCWKQQQLERKKKQFYLTITTNEVAYFGCTWFCYFFHFRDRIKCISHTTISSSSAFIGLFCCCYLFDPYEEAQFTSIRCYCLFIQTCLSFSIIGSPF